MPLALAPREIDAFFTYDRRVRIGQRADEVMRIGGARGVPHFVLGGVFPSVSDVVENRASKENRFLRD